LGKISQKGAEAIKSKVESLNAALIARIPFDKELAEWIGGLDVKLYGKLAAVGLVPKRQSPEQFTLGGWLDSYISIRSDVKDSTSTVYGHTRRCLIAYFGAERLLADITPGETDAWRIWLAEHEETRDGETVTVKLGENTIKRRCGIAKQFFRAAQRRKLIAENPFADMKGICVQRNRERFYFVSRAEADKVLAACPDGQWRLLFALSRYGGLRCPSEHLLLRWGDVDWERGRMKVRSPKTEHHEGGASRIVPIFPELRPYLEQVFEEAAPGTEFVITRYRDTNVNLRTQLQKIIARAGLLAWPKIFQNLRSTRQTELAEQFPAHVVCTWIGNSEEVAREHYLQVTEGHFERAIKAAQKTAQQEAGSARNDSHQVTKSTGNTICVGFKMGGTGLEQPLNLSKERRNHKRSAPLAPRIRPSHRIVTSRNWCHLHPN
jgi:integrase